MEYKSIIFDAQEGIANITLNVPEKFNALDISGILEFLDALKRSAESEAVRVVVLKANGKAFCSGVDIEYLVSGMVRTEKEVYNDVIQLGKISSLIMNMNKPVIAAVHGKAVGAGVNIALSADIIIASEDAEFSEIFSHIGLIPDTGGCYLLPRLIGRTRAMELMLTHKMISANNAYEIGLISKVVPAAAFLKEVAQFAQELAEGPTVAYSFIKKLINQSFETSFEGMLELESLYQSKASMTLDYKEGVKAVTQKRTAHFIGK